METLYNRRIFCKNENLDINCNIGTTAPSTTVWTVELKIIDTILGTIWRLAL